MSIGKFLDSTLPKLAERTNSHVPLDGIREMDADLSEVLPSLSIQLNREENKYKSAAFQRAYDTATALARQIAVIKATRSDYFSRISDGAAKQSAVIASSSEDLKVALTSPIGPTLISKVPILNSSNEIVLGE